MALRVPELCFWPAKTRKNPWTFRDAYISLTWCSNMAQTYMKETSYSYFFTSLYWLVWLPPLLEWFPFSCISCFGLKFSRIALWRKRMQLDSISDLTTNGLILEFFVQKWLLSSTSYLYGLISARIAQLLIVFDDINFFRCFVRGVLCSVL